MNQEDLNAMMRNQWEAANKPTLGKREANATPLAFRDELLRLALHSAT